MDDIVSNLTTAKVIEVPLLNVVWIKPLSETIFIHLQKQFRLEHQKVPKYFKNNAEIVANESSWLKIVV